MVSLQTLTICGQQLHSVDSARMMLRLGRMLPGLQVLCVCPGGLSGRRVCSPGCFGAVLLLGVRAATNPR